MAVAHVQHRVQRACLFRSHFQYSYYIAERDIKIHIVDSKPESSESNGIDFKNNVARFEHNFDDFFIPLPDPAYELRKIDSNRSKARKRRRRLVGPKWAENACSTGQCICCSRVRYITVITYIVSDEVLDEPKKLS